MKYDRMQLLHKGSRCANTSWQHLLSPGNKPTSSFERKPQTVNSIDRSHW